MAGNVFTCGIFFFFFVFGFGLRCRPTMGPWVGVAQWPMEWGDRGRGRVCGGRWGRETISRAITWGLPRSLENNYNHNTSCAVHQAGDKVKGRWKRPNKQRLNLGNWGIGGNTVITHLVMSWEMSHLTFSTSNQWPGITDSRQISKFIISLSHRILWQENHLHYKAYNSWCRGRICR